MRIKGYAWSRVFLLVSKQRERERDMSDLQTLLEDRLRSEQQFQQQLQALGEALRQQLQEAESRQREELDRRIHQNSLLSPDKDRDESDDDEQLHRQTRQHPVRTSRVTDRGTQQLQQQAPSKTQLAPVSKEEEAEAESQRKFCAVPVPSHVSLPRYHEMLQMREKERKQGREQRKSFLLSLQKPFSFQEREREKREKLIAMLSQVAQDQKNKVVTLRKPLHKVVKDSSDEELCRKVQTQTNSTVPHESPAQSGSPKPRTAERTKKEMLGFLDEKPSFQPKINRQIPDFSRLHKALQTEASRKTERKDATKCQPFHLWTSTLPTRQSRTSPEDSQVQRDHLKRSSSFGGLTSLSTDTLPTYITDAARKRCMAIRKSVELRESKKQESADWMRKHQTRSQAMKKTVAIRAKVLDPHSSLKEVYHEKVQQHREADQQRMREYMRELRDMKARVTVRPYLFEQVKQRNAKAHAEQTYRNKLKKAGLNEHFVEANGQAVEVTSETSRSEDDTDVDNRSTENEIHIREENVDDGEKIEDVEEKSVKSKGEAMP
ncbi:protein FAM161B [Centroberyx affinis]|uniref:protein FAM161B n=2 Tax=Centroberyx affinis TaxID=166261 RepID=UPI003A5C577C